MKLDCPYFNLCGGCNKLNISYEEERQETYRIKKMIPRGIVYLTYIIAENEDGMYIIDQHAAAERINYEKVLKEITQEHKQIFDLLVPIKVELPSNEYLILKKNIA